MGHLLPKSNGTITFFTRKKFLIDFIGLFFLFQEWNDMEQMQDDNNRIRDEIDALRGKYDALKRFAMLKNIPLPPELEHLP